jgi:DUSAM domain-containing protein
MDPEEEDWHEIRILDNRIQRGEALVLAPEVRELLLRTGPTVAISDADAALSSIETATALLHTIRRRITDGSNRLSDALHRMYRLRDAGRLDEARQEMRDVLSVEVVPLYREIAEDALANLSDRD